MNDWRSGASEVHRRHDSEPGRLGIVFHVAAAQSDAAASLRKRTDEHALIAERRNQDVTSVAVVVSPFFLPDRPPVHRGLAVAAPDPGHATRDHRNAPRVCSRDRSSP